MWIRYYVGVLFFLPVTFFGIVMGGAWSLVSLSLTLLLSMILDITLAHDTRNTEPNQMLINLLPYLYLPAGLALLLALSWRASPNDLFGVGFFFNNYFSITIIEKTDTLQELIIPAIYCGYGLSSCVVAAHELVHKQRDNYSVLLGRWTMALVGDAQFSISHVYGHHINIGTAKDSTTARRGENVYKFIIRSSIGQYRESLSVEQRRLKMENTLFRFVKNRVFSGGMMTVSLGVAIYYMTGWQGVFAYMIATLVAKILLEIINYIQHYGIVRVAGSKVELKHSWDCSNAFSSWTLLNLTRHADHHSNPTVDYWQLKNTGQQGINTGYIVHGLLALFPTLWFYIMESKLNLWDNKLASKQELEIVALNK
ncbi:fatty acid desaturase [Psychromonas sp. Urea-02u-13]|uniref:fatty acid desaturase n=1 Tax=Psychromonas sp. Urea-02u-13 TaxID=2058326 RepID=UPI000C32FA7E|nr:fatty acid desaturase [Psychromonas sp. Urea-02u-13]PKG37883.1 alkane 1-monooxygenase [Psychromonas sp. Urea-02u-13]